MQKLLAASSPCTRTAKSSRARSTNSSTGPSAAFTSGSIGRSPILPHAVLLDREIHWMYNKSVLQPWRKHNGSYLELVQSASRKFAALERQQAIDQALGELAEFFPAIKEAKLEKAALIKEVRATFGVPPGIDSVRPPSASPWPNCFLAGDWISTGWPSTMESAVRAPATWPPTPSAPAESKTAASSNPT